MKEGNKKMTPSYMKFTDLLKEDVDSDALISALKMLGYEVNEYGEIEWRGLRDKR